MHDTLLCIRRRATSADKRAAQPLTPAPWQTERRTHPRENQAAIDQRELLGASATKVEWPHSHRVLGMVPASALVFWLSIDGLKHLQDDIAKAPKLMVGKLDDGSFDGSFKETFEDRHRIPRNYVQRHKQKPDSCFTILSRLGTRSRWRWAAAPPPGTSSGWRTQG